MIFRPNAALIADTIKYSHWYQFPPKTEYLQAYMAPRRAFRGMKEVVWFGLHYYLLFLQGQFFKLNELLEAFRILNCMFDGKPTMHLEGDNGFRALAEQHQGRLPISIKAAPEGTRIPVGNVAMVIENTDPRFAWLVTFIETLLMKVWYPTMVATKSRAIKEQVHHYLVRSGDEDTLVGRVADFGSRSSTSIESQAIGGMGHLVNFEATTNCHAVQLAEQIYNCPIPRRAVHGMEHSCIIPWLRKGEADAYFNMLEHNPTGVITIVPDSYSLMSAIKDILFTQFRDKIMERDGVIAVRLDSPARDGDTLTKTAIEVTETIEERIGTVTNKKGYKELPAKVRLLQSDGVNVDSVMDILEQTVQNGYSANNLTFGTGNEIIQNVTRDMMSFAIKACHGVVDGDPREFRKEPEGASGKRSLMGKLRLVQIIGADGEPTFITEKEGESNRHDQLREVFRDGRVLVRYDMPEIRERSWP